MSNTPAYVEWIVCPVPENEHARIKALERYESSEHPPLPEGTFDRLATLAARITGLPVCFINLIGRDKQFAKASAGHPGEAIPRKKSFCQYTIMQNDILEVCDTTTHEIFCDSPFVKAESELVIRYYIGVPLTTPDGHNIGTLCLTDDKPNALTDEHKETLKVLADEIVSHYELKSAKLKLEKINKEKDELIRIVSHDLRNPLNGIIGFAEYLKSEMQNEEHREMLGLIEDAGQATMRIVNILLNSDYIKNEAFRLNCERHNVTELTREVIGLLRPFTLIKKQQISLHFTEDIYRTLDADKWKQIVGNLLSNASKFTPNEGNIELRLRVDEEMDKLELELEDNGIGMDEAMVGRLFTGKKSIQRAGTNGEDSSGLGMVLVKRYVELHDGTVQVTSKPGKGTRFVVRLP